MHIPSQKCANIWKTRLYGIADIMWQSENSFMWHSRDAHVTWTCHLYRDTRYFWRHNFPFGRGKMATADFRGHKRTILWKILCDFHVTARPKVYWVVRRVFFGQQSFLFESFCVPVSPFSPMILMKTLASVPAHSTSPVVTSISNVVILKKIDFNSMLTEHQLKTFNPSLKKTINLKARHFLIWISVVPIAVSESKGFQS